MSEREREKTRIRELKRKRKEGTQNYDLDGYMRVCLRLNSNTEPPSKFLFRETRKTHSGP